MMKFLRYPPVRMVIGLVMIIAGVGGALALLEIVSQPLRLAGQPKQVVALILITLVAHWAYVAFVWLLERRPVTELATAPAPRDLAIGTAIGVALLVAVVGTLWLAGCLEIQGRNAWQVMLVPFVVNVQAAYWEEIAIRGVMFRVLEEWLGTWVSLSVTAAFFGGLHLLNPNATAMGAIAIALSAGILLAGAYVVSRHLWLPIGLHFGWNFTLGGIFGLAVSGHQAKGWLQCRLEGPEWLTGGVFGIEASVVIIILGLLVGGLFFAVASRRGQIVPPPWGRRALGMEPAPIPNEESPDQLDLGGARKQP
jgi:membrane protease YdiL (CAAX protease family)